MEEARFRRREQARKAKQARGNPYRSTARPPTGATPAQQRPRVAASSGIGPQQQQHSFLGGMRRFAWGGKRMRPVVPSLDCEAAGKAAAAAAAAATTAEKAAKVAQLIQDITASRRALAISNRELNPRDAVVVAGLMPFNVSVRCKRGAHLV